MPKLMMHGSIICDTASLFIIINIITTLLSVSYLKVQCNNKHLGVIKSAYVDKHADNSNNSIR